MTIDQKLVRRTAILAIAIVLTVLFVDQASKFWVKTNMHYHERFSILGLKWAYIYFIENNGMAYGISFGNGIGKILLSVFRIVTVFFLIYYLSTLIRKNEKRGVIICLSLILAGALGNIIDSAFYGLLFSDSGFTPEGVATFLPPEGGYAPFLRGRVVDMLYFPMFDTVLPDWLPIWGGKDFQFFRPVFNVADSSIFIGIVSLLLFHRDFFSQLEKKKPKAEEKSTSTDTVAQ